MEFYRSFLDLGYHVSFFPDHAPPEICAKDLDVVAIGEEAARAAGYFDFCPTFRRASRTVAWDKALFYFCRLNPKFSHVWFIEDDVFVPSTDIIKQLDQRYPDADVLSRDNIVNTTGETDSWYWWQFIPRDVFPLPWAWSLVCAARLSQRLLVNLDQLLRISGDWLHTDTAPVATQRYRAPFIEYIFHTLALSKGMSVATAAELNQITWRGTWLPHELKATAIAHPVKDQELHAAARARMAAAGSAASIA
jgi:hypothetical protein